MNKEYMNSSGQAMMMIRLSHHALEMLQRYREKGQPLNLNYNVLNHGNAKLNMLVNTEQTKKSEDRPCGRDEFQEASTLWGKSKIK